ncbi:PhoD-like phosphatase domain-containing protein [Madurella fahalii]|uniref:PhoD-like phosphatase domain-containing protein n=1 Tax=Madurella fahalii TaxID=1157608 RepID=A0ABQ0FWX6_9PEZI
MSTPYWGQLPGPKAGQTTARRLSDDQVPLPERPTSLDAPGQGQARSNRISVQTTKSDAPTDSTMSPFASPTASSFQGQGLAPRPPSLPYGANQYPPELLENRRRRRSRNQEQDDEYAALAPQPPPAAPDVPRAPPVSYKYPPVSGGAAPYPYPIPPPGIGRPSRQMETEEYYKLSTPVGQREDHPVLDRPRNTLDESAMPRPQRVNTDPTFGKTGSPINGYHRRASAAEQSLQRSARRASAHHSTPRMFADDRSPLQRLELTLDSISKEDKRARVEAAERAARERAAAAAAANGAVPQGERGPQVHQVRFRERRPSVTAGDAPITPITPSRPAGPNGPLSQNPPEEGRRYSAAGGPSPRAAATESRIPVPAKQPSGIPQRNLSFRERAARNEMKLPNGLDDAAVEGISPTTVSNSRATATRNNKLKKNPPGNQWPNRISESDEINNAGETPPARSAKGVNTGPIHMPATPRADHDPEQAQLEALLRRAAAQDDADFGDEFLEYSPVAKVSRAASQRKADQILGRVPPHTAAPNGTRQLAAAAAVTPSAGATVRAVQPSPRRDDRDDSDAGEEKHHISDLIFHASDNLQPGQGMFKPTSYLEEWKQGTVGTLAGGLLDLDDVPPAVDKNTPWWDAAQSRKRSGSMSSRPKKAEAFEGEYDDTNAPTRFKPPLYLKCGPLLRYCGIRHERVPNRSARNGAVVDREIWRGSVMIVTTDADSSYDIAPTLRLFAQPIELLPPPPRVIQGDEPLAPEYVDPIAGHPKLGRKGETLYVRPVDHLEESRDISKDETDDGLFEKAKSPPEVPLPEGMVDPPGSFAARRKRAEMDGEKAGKYKDVRGFRLHAERGYTFWRFNIEIELQEKQQRIAYRINRGPSTGFWVPAKGQTMNIMFYSCNGFSISVDSDQFSGPDPMWRDVLNSHQSQPFHVMIGGGDQIYNDRCMQETKIFRDWLMIKNPLHKHNAPFTPEMQDELETYYLERYAMWFSQGLFSMANSQIPMVNMYDDHDIIDGFGSYPHHFMNSPVFSGLGNVAFKYYMLFQHQSVVDETEKTEPSWTLGVRPGPYIKELSRSLFMFLGSKVALLAVDARTERTREEVIREDTWKKIMDRCYGEIDKGKVEHLLVLLGVPIAYPRLVWLENILTSRVMDPVKALSKLGMFGGLLNRFDGGVEVLDDLDDHWTAKSHKQERSIVIEDLQDLAADKSIRITILSGDVHLAAIGQFYSNPKLGLAKHKDFRYMPNVISSAIVNTPPPDLMADILNKRNKVHHFDKETEEDMIPLFAHGVDGKPRNNKHLLPHRNWCAIREYVPGNTPLPTPNHSAFNFAPLGHPRGYASASSGLGRTLSGNLFRRLSTSGGSKDRTRPPISGGLLRSLSRRAGAASADEVGKPLPPKPGMLTRTMSGSSISGKFGGLFRRRSTSAAKRADDGGINGQWGPDTEEEDLPYDEEVPRPRGVGLRGGLGTGTSADYSDGSGNEFARDDERYFSAVKPQYPQHSNTSKERAAATTATMMTTMSGGITPGQQMPSRAPSHAPSRAPSSEQESVIAPPPKSLSFHRVPTGSLSGRLRRRGTGAEEYAVDLRGGLEVTLNVEISPKDPGGSTVPYRLVVPRLWYEYEGEEPEVGDAAAVDAGVVGSAGEKNVAVEEGRVPEGGMMEPGPQTEKKPGGIKRLMSLRRAG